MFHKQIILALLLFLTVNAYSQRSIHKNSLPEISYASNIENSLTAEELKKITEAYGEYSKKYVLDNPERLRSVKNILRNRVIIKQINSVNEQKEAPLLSTVSLFDSYVPNISRDLNFNPDTFNPLKYNFEFYSKSASMFKVDNTNYYIIIKSQYQ